MAREVLTAPLTLYVRSDALYSDAPGRIDSAAGACATWQQAIDLAEAFDANGQVITLQHGAEAGPVTFTAPMIFHERVGGGQLRIRGQSTPGNTIFHVTGADTFYLDNTGSPVLFTDLTARGGQTGIWMIVHNSRCVIESGVIVGTAVNSMFQVHDKGSLLYILSATPVTINGSANYAVFVNMGQAFIENTGFTMTGSPSFVAAFAQVISTGSIQSVSCTFTGATTGVRYSAATNGVINTFGGGASYFPGSSPGTTATGGQYG